MLPLFPQKYGNDALELVEVPLITAPDCYDAAIHGAAALIHTARWTSPVPRRPDRADDRDSVWARGREGRNSPRGERGGSVRHVALTSPS